MKSLEGNYVLILVAVLLAISLFSFFWAVPLLAGVLFAAVLLLKFKNASESQALERILAEKKQLEEKLHETKELLESVMQNTLEGIQVLNMEAKTVRVNGAFLKMFGREGDDLTGKTFLPMSLPEEDFRNIMRILSEGDHIHALEASGQRIDGAPVHLNLTISPLKDIRNQISGIAVIYRDITERRKIEEYLKNSDKLSAVGQLAAGLAHEIRNPLTSLKGFTQLLKSEKTGKQYYYDIMLSELERINSIVSEFLQVAKPHVSDIERKNMNQVVHDVVILMESQANLKNVTLSLRLDEAEDRFVLCSEVEMKQVLVNLIKNAIEAMPRGGEVLIELYCPQQQEIAVTIRDYGVGIPKEQLPLLGEPFFTTKETGTGLGLMMCYKIIQSNQGKINIRSEEGAGTTVEIILPAMRQQHS